MKLSKYLEKIAEYIPDGSKVIDVGCDHALLSIYLTKFKNCNVIATDISEKCILKANINIKKYQANVKTVITSGLDGVDYKNSIIILAGMGTHTILNILNRDITEDVIISSNTNLPLLRKMMYKKGYHIVNEAVVFDKHYYVIMYFRYGKKLKINYHISPFIKNKQYIIHLTNYYNLKMKNSKYFKKLKYYLIIIKLKKKV